ncbi:MAG: SpoIID/LytB domain-containing protein [Oligoflexia bacterium]|nr:SpoIID/LytB domain-containing protein [Oligoflexia bacterium]
MTLAQAVGPGHTDLMGGRMVAILVLFLASGVESHASLIPGAGTSGQGSDGEARVRVRLAEAATSVPIRGYDLKIYQTVRSAPALAYAAEKSSEWEFRCAGSRVRAISLRGNKTLDFAGPVTISTPAGLIRLGNRPYRDQIRIYAAGSFCEVVNELGVEKYLAGIVNAEFNSKWNESSIEAQVIAARTYALYQIRAQSQRDAHYDVDSTVRDQVYDGYGREDYRGSIAVEKTRGMALLAMGQGGNWLPIKAFYHSTCAGRTELPENVWGASFIGFKREVNCPYCGRSPAISWNLALTNSEIAQLMLRGVSGAGAPSGWPKGWRSVLTEGRLINLQPGSWTPSLRRGEIFSFWTDRFGNPVQLKVSAAKFREWVGAGRFKSTVFNVQPESLSGGILGWRFTGRGNGHGVGMCQWGAKTMGERGFSAVAILQHYYPDGVIRKLW